MRHTPFLISAVTKKAQSRITKFSLLSMKEIFLFLAMLLIYEWIFVPIVTAQPTTEEAIQNKITELVGQLTDENDSVRRDAAWSLGKMCDSKTSFPFINTAVQPLLNAITDESPDVRTYAANALGKIGDSRALQPLINALKDSDSNVRLMASNALGEIGDPQAEQPLNDVLNDEDERVRQAATKALKQIKTTTRQQVKLEAPEKEQLIQEKPLEETEENQTTISKSIDTQKRIEGFIKQLGDTNVRISSTAAKHLRAIRKPAEQPLIKALEDSNPNIRHSAVLILGDIGDVQSIEPLYKILSDGDSNIRKSAGLALGKIRSRVTNEEWDKEVQKYRANDRLETEREMAEMEERIHSEIQKRNRPIERTPFVTPRSPVVQQRQRIVQPSSLNRQTQPSRPSEKSIPSIVIKSIIFMAIGSLIMAVFVRLATKVVIKYDIPYWEAWEVSFLIALIVFVIRLVTAFINEPAFYILSVISQFTVAPLIYGRMIDDGEGSIGFVKGLLIHIVSIVATMVVTVGVIMILTWIIFTIMR